MLRGPMDGKPHTAICRRLDGPAHPRRTALCAEILCAMTALRRYFFLPSLRKMNSSEYFTPLPL